MKAFYRYEYGYLNVDDKGLYLSSTGNWSEIAKLNEKQAGKIYSGSIRRIRIILFTVLLLALLLALFVGNILSGQVSIPFLVLTAVGGFYFYRYMAPEIGATFKIPFHKLIDIKPNKDELTLVFRDVNNTENTVTLRYLKGFDLLALKELLICWDKHHSDSQADVINSGQPTN